MTKTIFFIAAFLAMIGMPGHAQSAAQKPLPAIVQKYVAAVRSTPTLSVDAAEVGASDTARIEIAAPNKIKIVSQADGKTTILVCDGKQVRQWNTVTVATNPAPGTLNKLTPELPMGAAASIASSLLTDSSNITDYANLRDAGIVQLDGQPVHQVVSIEDADTATFWLASDTGLPLKASYTGGRHDRVVTLNYWQVGRSLNTVSIARRVSPQRLSAVAACGPESLCRDAYPHPAGCRHRRAQFHTSLCRQQRRRHAHTGPIQPQGARCVD